MIRVIFLCILLLPAWSWCAPEDEVPDMPKEHYMALEGDLSDVPVPIFIFSQAQCMATLQHLFYPTSKIKEGLKFVLAENGAESSREDSLSCLEEISRKWSMDLAVPPAFIDSGYDDTKLRTLYEKARCVDNNPPGSTASQVFRATLPAGCDGKWITQAEWEPMAKILAQEEEKMRHFRAEQARISDLSFQLALALHKLGGSVSAQLDAAVRSASCFNPEKPGSKPFLHLQTAFARSCSGQWLNEAEKRKADALVAEKQKQVHEYSMGLGGKIVRFNSLFHKSGRLAAVNSPAFKKILDKLTCLNPFPEGSVDAKFYAQDGPNCEGKWTPANEVPALKKELFDNLGGDFETLLKGLEADEAKFKAKQEAEFAVKFRPLGTNISMRLLLRQYRGYLRSGGKPEEIKEFCAEHEQAQKRDRLFFTLNSSRMHATIPSASDKSETTKAENFRLTTSEQAALSSYMASSYGTINPILFSKKPLDQGMQAYKDTLDSALRRLPAHTAGKVIRYVDLPEKVADAHQAGATVCYDAYTSTSKTTGWTWTGRHRFVIYPGKRGRAVYQINDGEGEVLFEAGTCFKVISRIDKMDEKKPITEFVMAEVDEKGEVIGKVPNESKP